MTYDSLGRLVRNNEPNSGISKYAYNVDGSLVATEDARGCGQNMYYDGVGRLVARDYQPCLSHSAGDFATVGFYTVINGTSGCSQATYTDPSLDANGMPTGDGTEAFYVYSSDNNAGHHMGLLQDGRPLSRAAISPRRFNGPCSPTAPLTRRSA